MIKPESLWSLCKSCPDSTWIGDIMRALGGQEVALDFGQKQMLVAVQNDSQWMDERIEEKRERWKTRQARKRAKQDEQKSGLSRTVTPCHGDISMSRTIQPTIHPSNHPSVCVSNIRAPARTPARMDVPTCETVVAACEVTGVPTWYAKWWHAEMSARDWTKVDGSPVGNRNWRPVLKSWWNRDEKDAVHLQEIRDEYEKKVVVPKTYRPEDWALCAERCGNFCNGRCSKGVTVPPTLWERPTPPEECKRFCSSRQSHPAAGSQE